MTETEDPDRLMKICRASSSMPLVTPMVNIDGVPYLDGGLADSVPIRRAQKLGNEKIIVILTRNQGYRKKVISPAVQKLTDRHISPIRMQSGQSSEEVLSIIRR